MARQSGLGRGLGALIPAEDAPVDQSTAVWVDGAVNADGRRADVLRQIRVDAITANEFQPRERFDHESLDALTDSIRSLGVLQPILVRESTEGRYELIAGERRWRAATRAGLEQVPALVKQIDNRGSLEQALVENLHREDLNALEEAAAYKQLIEEFGLTQDEVAKRVGKSRPAVGNSLRLFQLSGELQQMLVQGDISAGHARAILSLPSAGEQESLAFRIVDEGMSVRQAEEAARAARGVVTEAEDEPEAAVEQKPIGAVRPPGLVELEGLLSERLSTRVAVQMGPKKGRVSIDFADLDDLERIYRLIGKS